MTMHKRLSSLWISCSIWQRRFRVAKSSIKSASRIHSSRYGNEQQKALTTSALLRSLKRPKVADMREAAGERAPLLPYSTATPPGPSAPEPSMQPKKRPWWLKLLNPRLTKRPWRVFEILDFRSVPGFVRRRCQTILTAAWVHKIPFFQKVSPAELAAVVILRTLEEIGDLDKNKISVIDFCSGAGGPIPTIERIVNEKRAAEGKRPIPFIMSDLHPNIDSWMEVCSTSKGSLSFIPQSVDATDPPVSAMSTTASDSRTSEGYRSDSRVFRLYCLSFHHFGDDLARKVLESTMQTADGFAIIELQDRYLSSFALMFGHIPLIYLTSIFRYWRDLMMLLLVYVVPLVPAINTFDGVVSCLRTRSFKEVMALIGAKEQGERTAEGEKTAVKENWVFKSKYEMHSWPVGYMSWITGRPERETSESSDSSP